VSKECLSHLQAFLVFRGARCSQETPSRQMGRCIRTLACPEQAQWSLSVDGVRTTLFTSLHREEAAQCSHGILEAFGNASWGTLKQEVCPLTVGCVSGPKQPHRTLILP
jgi:hypothetical protein